MTRNAEAWRRLGDAIRDDRIRQGYATMDALVEAIRAWGGKITTRTLGSIERGVIPASGNKSPSVEVAVKGLGWPLGAADRILAGESPAAVLGESATSSPGRERVLESLPGVFAWSREVVGLGGDPVLRDEFDAAAQRLVGSLPAPGSSEVSSQLALAAYRPHAEGHGPAEDDAERISRALK